jgi:DNA-binding PadR family transcriptional regulator
MAGSVTLVLLTVLEREELYGYDIALRLEALDDEILSLGEGTIYPTLHEMEKAGLVDSHEGTGRRGRRVRFYRITPKGRKQLKAMRASWKKVTEAVTQFVFAHA